MEEIRAYCFVGEPGSGKSRTINKILEDFFKVNINKPKIRNDFVISFPYGGELIGICSFGDSLSLLKKWLMILKTKGCNILIFACHPEEKLLNHLKNEFNNFKTIRCNETKNKENEEEWSVEHSRRIEQFKEVFQ
jgi:ABC-type dipeptide/oligopeptide/nickel transport system ATPase component